MSDFSPKECAAAVARLSPRQRAVLRLKALGRPNKQIADRLKLSHNTVRIYLERIYGKLAVHNASQATRVAIGARLI